MEYNELEKSIRTLHEAVNEFPIGAVSLDDFRPIEDKIRTARKSMMQLNARLLMLKAKYKQFTSGISTVHEEVDNVLQRAINDVLVNSKAVKLCLHSTTILSILDDREGNAEDMKKLYAYMSKLFTLNDSIISIQGLIEKASETQLDQKMECQKALFDYKNFLKEQEKKQSEKLQETYPNIVKNKEKMLKTLRKINIMKQLIKNFIAASGYMLAQKPILLEMLENHRELITVETIMKMPQDTSSND